MKVAKLFGSVLITVLLASPTVASACPGDISGDGAVGFSDLTQLLAAWGDCDGCIEDLVPSGQVGFADLTFLLAAWGDCPSPCDPDIPDFYEQFGSEIDKAAGGACAEGTCVNYDEEARTCRRYAGTGLPGACPEEDFLTYKAEIEHMIGAYPFTGAVFDGSQGVTQSYSTPLDTLICAGLGMVPENETLFADLDACYHATPRCLFDCDFVYVEFNWMVNVWDVLADYNEIAAANGGFCELDGAVGGAPVGFHATETSYGWREWNVQAKDQCAHFGCLCDAKLWMVFNPNDPTQYAVTGVENNSNCQEVELDEGVFETRCCEDPRFNF